METTNFFSKIAALGITGDLQLTIRKATDTNWLVSVILQNEQCGDNAKKLIPPLNLNGTSEELDDGFFAQIVAPMQAASGLMVNMEAFMKQLEEAKKQSAIEKEKADKERREKEVREKRFKEAMQKAEELEKEGKFRDAWMKVPEPAEYPEQAEMLRKRKSELAARFAPDLFAAPVTTAEPEIDDTVEPETDFDEYEDAEDYEANETED